MLSEQELREKVENFIAVHADVCYEVELHRKRVLYLIRIGYISLVVLAIILVVIANYYPVFIPFFLMLPIPIFFVIATPSLEGKKPLLGLHKELKTKLLKRVTQFLCNDLYYRSKEVYIPVVKEEPMNPFGIKPRKNIASHVIYGELNHLSVFFCEKVEFIADLFPDAVEYTGIVYIVNLKPFKAGVEPSAIADIPSVNSALAKLYPLLSNRVPTFRMMSEDQFQIIGLLEKKLFPIYRKLKTYNSDSLLPIFKQIYYLIYLVEVLDRDLNTLHN